jgi:hypothetical protein
MKIYEGHNKEGELVYFEVPNTLLSRRTAIKIIKSIPTAEVIKEEIKEEVFCTFRVGNRTFEIMEPFGDNSRYHIGERPIVNSNELEIIRQRFSDFKPGVLALFHR